MGPSDHDSPRMQTTDRHARRLNKSNMISEILAPCWPLWDGPAADINTVTYMVITEPPRWPLFIVRLVLNDLFEYKPFTVKLVLTAAIVLGGSVTLYTYVAFSHSHPPKLYHPDIYTPLVCDIHIDTSIKTCTTITITPTITNVCSPLNQHLVKQLYISVYKLYPNELGCHCVFEDGIGWAAT